MSALRARAPAKVNLCLWLGPSRPDGLHELVSVMWSISLADELELAPTAGAAGDQLDCAGVEGPNLAGRALEAFRSATGWSAPPQRLTIVKRIPVAAGLGGGSADAAATLRLAARAAGRDAGGLMALAPSLGADVPGQLDPGAVLVTGAGERVRPLPPPPPAGLVVVPLHQPLSTASVFARADRMGLPRTPEDLAAALAQLEGALEGGGGLPLGLAGNDLEPAARALCPLIDPALEAVRETGPAVAMVTGSGPTVVGVYPGETGAEQAREAAERLRGRFPGACPAAPVDAGFGAPEPVAVSA